MATKTKTNRRATRGRSLAMAFGMVPSKVSSIVKGLPRPVRYADPSTLPRLTPLTRPAFKGTPPELGDRLVRESSKVKGSVHGRSVLDEAKVIEMRKLRAEKGYSTGLLACLFDVSRNTACYAISGRTWGHAEGLPKAGEVEHAERCPDQDD